MLPYLGQDQISVEVAEHTTILTLTLTLTLILTLTLTLMRFPCNDFPTWYPQNFDFVRKIFFIILLTWNFADC